MKNHSHATQDGCGLIAAERARQASIGWSSDHDDCHENEELRDAAIAYAMVCDDAADNPPACWPFEPEKFRYQTSKAANLVKSGALLAAEIDRYRRAFQKACNEITSRDFGFNCFDESDAYDLDREPWVEIEPEDFVQLHFASTGKYRFLDEVDGERRQKGGGDEIQ